MPAWTMSGLRVSRIRARKARAYIGSHSRVDGRVGRRRVQLAGSDPAQDRGALAGSASAAASRKRVITGVMRIGPGVARRSIARAARTAALSSRGMDPWPHVPVMWIRYGAKPFSATWIGYSRLPAIVMATAAALVDRPGGPQPVRPVLGDPARAVERAGLLVGRAGEQDVAPQARDRVRGRIAAGGARLLDQPLDDAQLERDHALHVDRAAAVDVAVGDIGGERVVGPAIRRRRHDVEMGQQEERLATRPVAAQAGVDGAATRDGLEELRLEAEPDQALREVAGHAGLAVRRVGPAAG